MICKAITYMEQPATIACDAKCNKAWGIQNRPERTLSDNPDDYVFLSDSELGEAPADPGTAEGGDGKPTSKGDRLNRWCCRECERCWMSKPGNAAQEIVLPDFDNPSPNIPR